MSFIAPSSRFRIALCAVLCLVLCFVGVPSVTAQEASSASSASRGPVAIVIHGGAGTILPENITDEQEQAYRAALQQALEAGHAVLQDGGSSTDAVVAAITTMEDSPLFNAGKGAVFTDEGTVELDASIMEGETRNAGALTGVKRVKSPIHLARTIMEESPHVMMAGEGAETFAQSHGLTMVENEYFYTERRRKQAEEARGKPFQLSPSDERSPGDKSSSEEAGGGDRPGVPADPMDKKFGTVGAVALDQAGTLTAGTSTGGMTNKRFGRVGDSPIIGAGTYASNETCGISATGHGEYFMRAVVAHNIAARMKHGGQSVEEAARAVIMDELTAMGGTGGVIAMDAEGNIAMPFNTPGMYRGYIDTDGNMVIRIFKEDAVMSE